MTIIIASFLFAFYAVFVVYLGLYAYGNPDPAHCYFIDGLDTTGTTRANAVTLAEDRGIEVKPGFPIDMAHLFRCWFIWGFWDKMFQISIFAVFLPLSQWNNLRWKRLQTITFLIFQTLAILSFLIWFIVGFFWRFSRAGRVASGDKLERMAGTTDSEWSDSLDAAVSADGYQFKSGKFMAVYLSTSFILSVIMVTFGSVTATLCCCLRSVNDKAAANSEKNPLEKTGSGPTNNDYFIFDRQDDGTTGENLDGDHQTMKSGRDRESLSKLRHKALFAPTNASSQRHQLFDQDGERNDDYSNEYGYDQQREHQERQQQLDSVRSEQQEQVQVQAVMIGGINYIARKSTEMEAES